MSPSPLSPASNPQNPARAPAGHLASTTPRTRAEKHLFSHSTQHTAHISALVESRPYWGIGDWEGRDLMSRGHSQHWSQILEATIGERVISSSALNRYYRPLYVLLEKFVRAHRVPIGW
uniref:SFRICE_017887 n=1 Tax=Spodoptera frugiperda TaxID=7108 RepID=A0A2H1V8R2_SPOFR